MITDSYNYVNQAIAFSEGTTTFTRTDFLSGESISMIPAPYNTGTSFLLSLAIGAIGKQAIFLIPLIQVLLSVYLLSLTLIRNQYTQSALSILGLSLALMFFSRSTMSCMPSFMLVSIACFFFFRAKASRYTALMLSILAGLGFWFRESNIFLLAPLVVYVLYKNIRLFLPACIGFLLGLSPKIIADKVVYDTYWFFSGSSGFSLKSLVDHIPEYAIILMLLLPFSLFFIVSYKGKADKTIKSLSIAFIVLYLVYQYSAVDFSGLLKGSFLTSRFMIPLLPLIVICAGESASRSRITHKILQLFVLGSIVCIPLSQYLFKQLYAHHEQASKAVQQNTNGKETFYDLTGYTNIIRYYNPLVSEVQKVSSIQHLKEKEKLSPYQVILISRSDASPEKKMRADSMKSIIHHLPTHLYKKIPIDEGNWIELYKAQ